MICGGVSSFSSLFSRKPELYEKIELKISVFYLLFILLISAQVTSSERIFHASTGAQTSRRVSY
jgi:hypothetical protein